MPPWYDSLLKKPLFHHSEGDLLRIALHLTHVSLILMIFLDHWTQRHPPLRGSDEIWVQLLDLHFRSMVDSTRTIEDQYQEPAEEEEEE